MDSLLYVSSVKTMQRAEDAGIIHKSDGKWFFWDESWAHEHGPYDSREEAERALDNYADFILNKR